MKINIIIIIIFVIVYGCGEELIQKPSKPEIIEILPSRSGVWSIITIYGNNFGHPNDSAYVMLDTIYRVFGKESLKWNNSFIRIKIPKIMFNGNIRIVHGKDTSNIYKINFNFLPVIEMVRITSGIAEIGSNDGWFNEKPAHRVNISFDILVSKYEVSQYLYDFVCDTNPSTEKAFDHPVNNISWNDAIKFCNKLSKIFNYDTSYIFDDGNIIWDTNANGFRLPTEAEWEFFCRLGNLGDYNVNENIDNLAWFNKNSGFKIHPIGKKLPNSAGIYDLHGNVSEWCWDWYDENYYRKSSAVNPKGPLTGSVRVHRGGSFLDGFANVRSSTRHYDDGNYKKMGIRIVRSIKE